MADRKETSFTAGKNDAGRRLDRVVRKLSGKNLPLSAVYAGLRRGGILVNGKKAEPSYLLRPGDKLLFRGALSEAVSTQQTDPKKARMHADTGFSGEIIVYEDEHLLVLNKPPGALTHGKNSLQESVAQYLRKISADSLAFSPAPLHRLDRNTSGLIVFGKSIEGSQKFAEMLRKKEIVKVYLGVHHGSIREDQFWEDRLTRNRERRRTRVAQAGEAAALSVHPLLSSSRNYGLSLLVPHTGRTHQIRVQCASRGYALAGDRKYGSSAGTALKGRQLLLHACMLFFSSEDSVIGEHTFYAPPPKSFRESAAVLMPGSGLGGFFSGLELKIKEKISSIYRS